MLDLKNVLCFPKIAKNLISVPKLAHDNKVFPEFYDGHCLVKDTHRGKVVLKGEFTNELYHFGTTKATSSTARSIDSYLESDDKIMACFNVV